VVLAMTAAVAVAFAAIAVYARHEFGDVDLGFNGYLALALGAFFTAALGIALMTLLFFSDRRGFDDEAGRPEKHRKHD